MNLCIDNEILNELDLLIIFACIITYKKLISYIACHV